MVEKQMSIEQALQVIKNVCGAYKGSLQEHTTIQTALQVIQLELMKPKVNLKNSTIKNSNIIIDGKEKVEPK